MTLQSWEQSEKEKKHGTTDKRNWWATALILCFPGQEVIYVDVSNTKIVSVIFLNVCFKPLQARDHALQIETETSLSYYGKTERGSLWFPRKCYVPGGFM